MKNLLIIVAAFFLMRCESKEQESRNLSMESDSIKLPDAYTIIVPDSSQLHCQFIDYHKSVELKSEEIKAIELIIFNALLEETKKGKSIPIKPSKLHTIKRQYISYENKQGERIIWVNAFCEVPKIVIEVSPGVLQSKEMDWKNELIQVEDGGECFWNIKINMDTNKSEMQINGVA